MPVKGTSKEKRQYQKIKKSAQKSGRYGKRAKEVAARTVMKQRAQRKKKGSSSGSRSKSRSSGSGRTRSSSSRRKSGSSRSRSRSR